MSLSMQGSNGLSLAMRRAHRAASHQTASAADPLPVASHCMHTQVSVERRIGKDRAGPGRTYAFKSLLQVQQHRRICRQQSQVILAVGAEPPCMALAEWHSVPRA